MPGLFHSKSSNAQIVSSLVNSGTLGTEIYIDPGTPDPAVLFAMLWQGDIPINGATFRAFVGEDEMEFIAGPMWSNVHQTLQTFKLIGPPTGQRLTVTGSFSGVPLGFITRNLTIGAVVYYGVAEFSDPVVNTFMLNQSTVTVESDTAAETIITMHGVGGVNSFTSYTLNERLKRRSWGAGGGEILIGDAPGGGSIVGTATDLIPFFQLNAAVGISVIPAVVSSSGSLDIYGPSFSSGLSHIQGRTLPGPPVDASQFVVDDNGAVAPQPWMQWRCVATDTAPQTSGSYAVTTAGDNTLTSAQMAFGGTLGNLFNNITRIRDQALGLLSAALGGQLLHGSNAPAPDTVAGGAKNDLLYGLQTEWTNTTPIDQWVYGMITRGGVRMTVQARTKAYILVLSGFTVGPPVDANNPLTMTLSSAMGCGADIGLGGVLNIGTAYCIHEQRQNATSFPVQPEICGWQRVPPGDTYSAAMQVRYASPTWESSSIDGGQVNTETSYDDGGSRLDLYALPVLPAQITPVTWTNIPVTDAPTPAGNSGCFVTLVGTGGGGAGGLPGQDGGGGGGGGGAIIGPVFLSASALGPTWSCGIGVPGAAGAANSPGGDGTATFFTSGSISLSAGGGQGGGQGGDITAAGAGGTITVIGADDSIGFPGGAGGIGGNDIDLDGAAAEDVTTGAPAGGGGGGTGVTGDSGVGGDGGDSSTATGGAGSAATADGGTPLPVPAGTIAGGAGGGGGGGYGFIGTAGGGGAGGIYGGGGGGGGGKTGTANVGVGGPGGIGGILVQWV